MLTIRTVEDRDIDAITAIYNYYILHTIITFETTAIAPSEMARRIEDKLTRYVWLVAELDQEMIGYAYYGAFHPRAAYAHTVEPTIYLHPDKTGQGWGQLLYRELIQSAQNQGFQELVALIALPNPGSLGLHEKMGFHAVGQLKNVGYKFDQYLDVVFWQKSLVG
jgi:phosphinothricin acetyltransferase